MCSVFLPQEDRVVNIMCDHLDPVQPQRGDAFKVRIKLLLKICILLLFSHFQVIIGEEREATGELLSIDCNEGVVKVMDDIKLLPLQNLCKIRKLDH